MFECCGHVADRAGSSAGSTSAKMYRHEAATRRNSAGAARRASNSGTILAVLCLSLRVLAVLAQGEAPAAPAAKGPSAAPPAAAGEKKKASEPLPPS